MEAFLKTYQDVSILENKLEMFSDDVKDKTRLFETF